MRFAIRLAIEQKHRIATQNERSHPGSGQPAPFSGERLLQRLFGARNSHTGKIAGLRLGACVVGERRGRIVRSHGVERTAGHMLPCRFARGLGDRKIGLVYGERLGFGEKHHLGVDRQLIHGDAPFVGRPGEHRVFVHMRNADRGADTGVEQDVTAWLGFGSENQRYGHGV